MNIIAEMEKKQMLERSKFRSGDTVRIHYKIVEGGKERIQVFEGLVISISNKV